MKRTFSVMVVLLAGACVRAGAPTPRPTPANAAPELAAASATIAQQGSPVPVSPASVVSTPTAANVGDSIRIDAKDVARRATEVFGDAPAATTAPAAEPDATAVGPSWDIDVRSYESTDRVEHYVRIFTGRARERIGQQLERGSRYEAMIRGRMRDGGLPEDMYYLAMIESGFDANAYSRAAAVGMWQFMTSTARDMGMRVDWWIDERRDPFRSTTAAVRFIKGLREQFGSLYLAAAAYNGGPGRIARGLTRYADDLEGTTGDDLFFALAEKDYLRNETREYVPQLIAAALIAKEPQRYGVTFTPQPALTYDSVRVAPATAIAAVARAAGATLDDVRQLNPHILRGVTPPRDSFFVRVPAGTDSVAAAALADMPKSARVGLLTIESKKGQTFESIARETGVSARSLAAYNPKVKTLKRGRLVPGQAVLIPTAAVASVAVNIPDPDIERYGTSTKSATMHVVKSGETLGGIAKKYGTTSDALMKRNGLKRPLIFPGQSLVVKGKSSAPAGKRVTVVSPRKPSAKPAKIKASAPAKKRAGAPVRKTPARKVAGKKNRLPRR